MKIKATPGERVFQACNYVFLTLLAFVCLYPMWHVLMASFSDSDALIAHSGLLLLPVELSPDAYQRVLSNHLVWIGYWNTLKLLVLGVSWQMVMTTLGAYVLSLAGVAPDIYTPCVVYGKRVVVANGNIHYICISNLIRYIGNINRVCDRGIAPYIQISVI